MGRSYEEELVALSAAYAAACAVPDEDLSGLRSDLVGGPAVFVGAGGAFSCAKLAAELHERFCGSIAKASTPLEVVSQPPSENAALVLISARARHPDTAAAATAAIAAGTRRILLLTQREHHELEGILSHPSILYHNVPAPSERDGFLATGSLLASATLLVRAYNTQQILPTQLPSFGAEPAYEVRRRLIVLYGLDTSAPAHDIETRFNETGLADVQLTDYRNFGHGRHYGFSRRLGDTTVIALSTKDTLDLADRTLRVLPDEAHIVRLHSSLPWPISALDLLVQTAQSIQHSARTANINLAKPQVPSFGRRLYHLNPAAKKRMIVEPIRSKVKEAIPKGPCDDMYRSYEQALNSWQNLMGETIFSGLVMDYDGTVCATSERFTLPCQIVRTQIERLLSGGAVVGFASGRGSSLYNDLQKWVPRTYWAQIHLGLYNGSVVLKLDDELPDWSEGPSAELKEAYERLQASSFGNLFDMKIKRYQLSIQGSKNTCVPMKSLFDITVSLLNRHPQLPLTAVASGHSIDVVPADATKTKVYDALATASGTAKLLAIGDQGQPGGNDHVLLAYSEYTLSVDRCSADPTRCWNLIGRSERGPDGLAKYIKSIEVSAKNRLRFAWEHP